MLWNGALFVVVAIALGVRVQGDEEEEWDDTAAFALAVEGDGARCGGALVALRAALTAGRCARGAAELWVRAHGRGGAPRVRVLRVVLADLHTDVVPVVAGADGEWVWGGVGADLALLELEAPVRDARPILVAAAGECDPRAACHVPRGRARRLRIVGLELVSPPRCVARGARWPTPLHEHALCLLGSRLCRVDWGAAVVCGGKLCGVISRSAQSEGEDGDGDGEQGDREQEDGEATRNETQCGDTHAAASVPRAHRFLRCAMRLGACGRGECERVCAERWLHHVQPPPPSTPAPAPAHASLHALKHANAPAPVTMRAPQHASAAAAPALATASTHVPTHKRAPAPALVPARAPALRAHYDYYKEDSVITSGGERRVAASGSDAEPEAHTSVVTVEGSTQPDAHPRRTPLPAPALAPASTRARAPFSAPVLGSAHGSVEFEPNRADFKMTPARTSAVCLKAGEYGDHAAEYGAEDAGGGGGGGVAISTPRGTPTRSTPWALHAELEARVAPVAPAAATPHAAPYEGEASRAPPARGLAPPNLLLAALYPLARLCSRWTRNTPLT